MKKHRYIILLAFAALLLTAIYFLWQPMMRFVSDPQSIRVWIAEKGTFGVILFAMLNMLQVVVAVIPGGPFEVAAGYLFGAVWGTLLCDSAMTCASVVVFLVVKRFGLPFIHLFFTQEQIDSVRILKDTKRLRSILFFLFLIPGTPKDLLTYLAGLTELTLPNWIFICFVGRLPAILFSALGGSALGQARYIAVFVLGAILAICYLIGTNIYQRMNAKVDNR